MCVINKWESEGFIYEASGIVTTDEIIEATEAFYNVPEGFVPRYQIVNALKVEDIYYNPVELVNIAADDLAFSRKYPEMKIALIAKEGPVMDNMMKYLKISWAINNAWEFRVFSSLDAARDWLGLIPA
ncbi:hypothetical protein [Poritiphilus flavus]|uniref:SpoIIAA-like n=1 Tax=Poritiphilus flavus TaxID=2697053 RepID=A0A6L9E7J5_9FLAO|nr:hypothetical protein [Poritiphilus flavus]NAS10755.1 hypothetical protein [Poritiphilus flavus]